MHEAAISPRGGVAGPQVSGAIRNQFNQVTNTVDSGTDGGNFMSAEEKAYQEAMKTVVNKDAKDWTLDEQKAAATDIAKNGTSSVVYAKAMAAMDAGTRWSVKLKNGKTMTYQIIGINHDDLADGSGKAGLTFMTGYRTFGDHRINSEDTTTGGWEQSELSQKMNSGEVWNLMPSDLQSKVKSVTKLTNNTKGQDQNSSVTSTNDKLFLPSSTEHWGDKDSDGAQYELYKEKGCTSSTDNRAYIWSSVWTRSLVGNYGFRCTDNDGCPNWSVPQGANSVFPAFCL